MPFQAVIFDLGGVVLGSPLHAIAHYEKELGIAAGSVNRVVGSTGEAGAWSKLERGLFNLEQFFPAFEKDCAAAGFTISASTMFERMGAESAPRPMMMRAIERIREEGLRTAALTNNWATGDPGPNPLRPFFDEFVESAIEGLQKPDPRIYDLVLGRLNVPADAAVFLDDIGRNLKTAREMGMTTIKVDDPAVALAALEEHLGFPLS
ncbi:MAG: HAD family phosphatase [Candidatus Binatia bacterium]|nr:HAD family phosphatase [Candidatus Binatia bacterium]MDG1959683.1 HAD family phosphatase [Candidatus Binatia bacterium]MDG2010256.1 HAD family phosphatase [Candidatus Binatia bacterium]HAC80625.1 haloacid dehalogenase [Deltaproteobacteria bacterium]